MRRMCAHLNVGRTLLRAAAATALLLVAACAETQPTPGPEPVSAVPISAPPSMQAAAQTPPSSPAPANAQPNTDTAAAPANAQPNINAAAAPANAKLPDDQLDSLVAPIALYPDPLLAQVLAASTYPLELIQLQQWLKRIPA